MNDRELLAMAAKAAGYQLGEWSDRAEGFFQPQFDYDAWNPLRNDGDALRLAAKLYLIISYDVPHSSWVSCGMRLGPFSTETIPIVGFREHDAVVQAATRRAIVRAAAEIGKAMP